MFKFDYTTQFKACYSGGVNTVCSSLITRRNLKLVILAEWRSKHSLFKFDYTTQFKACYSGGVNTVNTVCSSLITRRNLKLVILAE